METTPKTELAPVNSAGNASETAPALPVKASDLTGNLIAGMPEGPKTERPAPVFQTDEPKLPDPGTTPLPGFEALPVKDDGGTEFDPSQHMANPDGSPAKNKKGRFYSKFIGRGGAAKKTGENGNPTPQVERPAPKFDGAPPEKVFLNGADGGPGEIKVTVNQPAQPDEADGISLLVIPTVDGIAQAIFGKDIALSPDEMKNAQPAVAAYMRAKNAKDISPGWALVLIATAIYGPKFQKPTVKERIALYILKIKNLFNRK